MNEYIELKLSDWQFNIGLVGLYNILKYNNDEVEILDDTLKFKVSLLENFEEKYFKYLIDKYEDYEYFNRWFILKRYKETLDKLNDVENKIKSDSLEEKLVDELLIDILKSLEVNRIKKIDNSKLIEDIIFSINKVTDKLIDYLKKRNNYSKVYPLIELDTSEKINKLVEKLTKIKFSKKINKYDILKYLLDNKENIYELYKIVYSKNGRKYLFAKSIIYSLIENSWSGISFLNPQTKEIDPYVDFNKHFIVPILKYIESDKSKFLLKCFVTGLPIKNSSEAHSLSFINETGFDTSRKSSNIWNFSNDIYICDIARLVYICMPAGFVYSPINQEAIFINANSSMEQLIETNYKFYNNLTGKIELRSKNVSLYKAIIDSLRNLDNKVLNKFELSDVQIIKHIKDINGNYRYSFNLFSKEIIKKINNSYEDLEKIIDNNYREADTPKYIYTEVIDNIFNNLFMTQLINKLLLILLSNNSQKGFFNATTIYYIIKIQNSLIGGNDNMEKDNSLWISRKNGLDLANKYRENKIESKINSISYRLLNALKTKNADLFLHILINAYMYIDKPIPSYIETVLENDEKLSKIGYSFLTGLLTEKEKSSEGENNE